jgi:hypothetical protein
VSARSRRRAVRAATSVPAAVGAALLTRPRQVLRLVAPDEPGPPLAVVRVLGGRLVVQHALVALRPTRRRLLAGAVVDAVHAVSMVPAAALWPAHRRQAAASGAVGAASALVTLALVPAVTPAPAVALRVTRRWSGAPARSRRSRARS